MNENDFVINWQDFDLNQAVEITAESPSNIALIKYWGKTDPQIPTNPSLSYTLGKSKTITSLKAQKKQADKAKIHVLLNGIETPSFVPKIEKFIQQIEPYAGYLTQLDLWIETQNTFPHSSGIASSASGMSTLAKIWTELESFYGLKLNSEEKAKRASFLARLGSGSACRSIYKGLIEWGETSLVNGSSNLYAIPLETEIQSVFKTFQDTILLIHEGQKSVSSTVGHQLMNNHPYAEQRFEQANLNLGKMISILKDGNLAEFGKLVEHEALSLHAMMLTSDPAFLLMHSGTLEVINKVWNFRKETDANLYFTLDAGANVHLLYPEAEKELIHSFIENELLQHTQNRKAIFDQVQF